MEKTRIIDIKTSKFKSITVDFRFVKPFDKKERSALLMLSSFIGKYSEQYRDKLSMTKAKDMLYGIKVNTSSKSFGKLMSFGVSFQFVNPKYLNDVKAFDYIDFIDECLSHPYFDEKLFKEHQNNLISDIKRFLDKPRNLETNNLVLEISKDIPDFVIYSKDLVQDVEDLKLEDVKLCYHSLFKDYSVKLFLLGDYSTDFDHAFDKYLTSDHAYYQTSKAYQLKLKDDVITNQDSEQSYLSIVYQSPYTRKHKDYYAFVLCNMVFGGSPLSLLFAEVREKQSLCYSIDTIPYKDEGLVRVTTGIDADKFEAVKKAVMTQLEKLQTGNFDDAIIEASRKLMINNILSLSDDSEDYINFIFNNSLYQDVVDVDSYIEGIKSVTKSDIMEVAKNYQPYLCHFLKGEIHE